MGGLSIRCLGGFAVARGEDPVEGFESRKVRALLAYLVCNRDRALPRAQLAGLLWPEMDERHGRRNLRQALYNLRGVLAADGGAPPIFARQGGVRLAPERGCWIDVEAFDAVVQHGLGRQATSSPHELASAVRLYRGDFLAGLSLDGAGELEAWRERERERLREGMIGALRALVDSYLQRGELRLGIQFAQRLVSMDPLSEEGHRYLIQLFALSGRRRRALDQYRSLERLLDRELGVAPLADTQRLHQTVLADRSPMPLADEETEPIGPLVPLVGRTRDFGALTRDWQALLRGEARFSLIEGEMGIGKSRLGRSFLDAASGHREVTVLIGRGFDRVPRPYQPFGGALRCLLADERTAERIPASAACLGRWIPELAGGSPERAADAPTGRDQLFSAVAELLDAQMAPSGGRRRRPLVLFLDDLDAATGETFDLAAYLLDMLADRPLWLLATARDGARVTARMRTALDACHAAAPLAALRLEPLGRSALREVATWLLGAEDAAPLAEMLIEHTGGLPLHVAELINSLWDQDALRSAGGGRWRLVAPDPSALGVGPLRPMLGKRLARLPYSARRLATLAAVIGEAFEPEIVRRTADEHPTVIEVGLEMLLERWILRQNADRWTASARQRDIVMWTRGARKGRFDFAHRHTREALYGAVSIGRRELIHAQVAAALDTPDGHTSSAVSEQLACHFRQAGDDATAARHAERAAARARSLFADEVADFYDAMAHIRGRRRADRVEPDTGAIAVS